MLVTRKASGYTFGYAGKPCSYVSYAVTRTFPTTHVRPRARGIYTLSREQNKTTCNRVTHVTTGIPRVTARVTNPFSRNYKELMMSDESRDEKRKWVQDNMPTCAAIAAEFKNVFGDVRLVYASEAGHVIGKLGQDGVKLSDTVVGSMSASGKAKP